MADLQHDSRASSADARTTSRPRVVVHNTISIDGAVRGFPVDMGVHYGLVPAWGAEVHLVGSATFASGIEAFGGVEETAAHRTPPVVDDGDRRPWWVIPDSTGRLEGLLHNARAFGACRDVVVLVTDRTPMSYLGYLMERDYPVHILGEDRVDLEAAVSLCASRYGATSVLVDGGPALVGALLDAGLVDVLSLVVNPAIVGGDPGAEVGATSLFAQAPAVDLHVVRHEDAGAGVHLVLEVAAPQGQAA